MVLAFFSSSLVNTEIRVGSCWTNATIKHPVGSFWAASASAAGLENARDVRRSMVTGAAALEQFQEMKQMAPQLRWEKYSERR